MIAALTSSMLALVLVLIMLASCFAIGSWILTCIRGEWVPAERLVFSIALGCGALATALLALGVIGLLQAVPIWGTVLGAGALAWRQFEHLSPGLRGAFAPLQGWSTASAWLIRLILAAVILLLLLGALPPTTDWDSLMYHLEIPREFLRAGRIFVPDDNLHVAYVGLWQMLYLPFLVVGASAGPALFNSAVAVLLGLAVSVAADRLFGRTTAVVAFVSLWGTVSIVLVAGTARVDVSLAFVLLLAHYALVSAAEAEQRGKIILAAALAGIAAGVKYHALLYLVALVPVAIWAAIRTSGRTRLTVRLITVGLAMGAAVTLPWLVKNWALLGAPLYPFFSERLMPPWLTTLAGSRALPAGVSPDIFSVLGQARDPVSLWALLFDPASLTVEAEARAFATTPAVYLLPFALVFIRSPRMAMLLIPAVGYLLLLTTVSEFINLRYLIPAVPALALVIAETARRAGIALLDEGKLRVLLLAGAFLSLIPAVRGVRLNLLTAPRAAATFGTISNAEYLAGNRVPGFSAYYAATRWVNNYTEPGARILLFFIGRGYYFDRDVLQDNDLTNWPLLLATGAPRHCLEGSGITHVLVDHGAATYYRIRGSNLNVLRWNVFPEFAARCLESVHTEGFHELFRVRSVAGDG